MQTNWVHLLKLPVGLQIHLTTTTITNRLHIRKRFDMPSALASQIAACGAALTTSLRHIDSLAYAALQHWVCVQQLRLSGEKPGVKAGNSAHKKVLHVRTPRHSPKHVAQALQPAEPSMQQPHLRRILLLHPPPPHKHRPAPSGARAIHRNLRAQASACAPTAAADWGQLLPTVTPQLACA
jgi:hypothetical protein